MLEDAISPNKHEAGPRPLGPCLSQSWRLESGGVMRDRGSRTSRARDFRWKGTHARPTTRVQATGKTARTRVSPGCWAQAIRFAFVWSSFGSPAASP